MVPFGILKAGMLAALFILQSELLMALEKHAVFDLAKISETRLDVIKHQLTNYLWVELDNQLYVKGDGEGLKDLEKELPARWVSDRLLSHGLYLATGHHHRVETKSGHTILVSSGRKALILSDREMPEQARDIDEHRYTLVTGSQVFVKNLSRRGVSSQLIPFPEVAQELVQGVNGERWLAHVTRLSSFNRYLKSEEMPGVIEFIEQKFAALPGFRVYKEEFMVGSVTGVNIIAEISGRTQPEQVVIVGAHYDSISEDPFESAPGAEDNGSGTAALFEMAEIISKTPPEKTIRFIAFSGEEQGLYGSKDYVNRVIERNEKNQIKMALIMDMIGYTSDQDLDCLIETSRANQLVVDVLSQSGQKFSRLRMLSTFNYWGSDHVPFLRNQIPATLIIENDYGSYPAYHRSDDLPELLSQQMGAEVIKMNLGGLSYWAY